MKWANFPYWLKGGVVGAGIALVFSVLNISCLFILGRDSWGFECLPLALPSLPVVSILLKIPGAESLSSFPIFLFEFVAYFIFGALTALLLSILGKVKK